MLGVESEWASDIKSKPNQKQKLWTVIRRGDHCAFMAQGGRMMRDDSTEQKKAPPGGHITGNYMDPLLPIKILELDSPSAHALAV